MIISVPLISLPIVMFASFYLIETLFRGLEGCYDFYHTFPISNLTPEPRFGFSQIIFSK